MKLKWSGDWAFGLSVSKTAECGGGFTLTIILVIIVIQLGFE